MKQTNINNSKLRNTNVWNILYILIFTIAPMIIVWLLVGEFNFAKRNWFWFDGDNNKLIITWQPFIIMFSILFINIGLFLTLTYFNFLKLSGFNFCVATWFLLFSLICSGLIIPNKDSYAWIIALRIGIIIISFAVSFIISNLITSRLLIKTKLGQDYAQQIIVDEYNNKKYINENIKPLKKPTSKHKKTSIEIKE